MRARHILFTLPLHFPSFRGLGAESRTVATAYALFLVRLHLH